MSPIESYDKGIEAASSRVNSVNARWAIDAFLAEQPVIWWCFQRQGMCEHVTPAFREKGDLEALRGHEHCGPVHIVAKRREER